MHTAHRIRKEAAYPIMNTAQRLIGMLVQLALRSHQATRQIEPQHAAIERPVQL